MKSYRLEELSPESLEELCRRNPVADPEMMETCRAIFDDVSRLGDEAVGKYTRRFDGVDLSDHRVSSQEFSQAAEGISNTAVRALKRAAHNIQTFHASQQVSEGLVKVEPGVRCWRENRAIDSVGLYVPGGNAVLPSRPSNSANVSKVEASSRSPF